MAIPYPEGEVFFKRSLLKNNDDGLNPDDLKSFNSHALIEWCWNDTPKDASGGKTRNRLVYAKGKYNENEKYYYWRQMNIMFGTKEGFENTVQSSDGRHYSRHSDIKRHIRIGLPGDTEEYEKRKKGGPLMTALTAIKLEPGEPYMYIDLVFPVRAIYFPLAQKPSSVFPDLCSYLMVDFRLRQGIAMWDTVESKKVVSKPPPKSQPMDYPEGYPAELVAMAKQFRDARLDSSTSSYSKPIPMDFDLYAGLGNKPDKMISLYIPGIYNYLILPRQLRSVERGLYLPTDRSKSLIRVHDIGCIDTTSDFIHAKVIDQKLSLKLDLTKVLENHLGVQVVWQPFDIPEPEDANQMLIDMTEAGLCFIPVVGPLASTCFGLFIEIVRDPEAFKAMNPFEMSGYMLADAAAAAEQIADGLPKYSEAGKLAKFLATVGGALTKISKPSESEVKK